MLELTIGTKCRVYLQTENEKIGVSIGKFMGFINIGEDSALVLEMEEVEGKYRIIPISSIVAIDVIELKKADEKKEEIPSYFK